MKGIIHHLLLLLAVTLVAEAQDQKRDEFLRSAVDLEVIEAAAAGKTFYLRLVVGGDFAPEQACYEYATHVPKSDLFPNSTRRGGGQIVRSSPNDRHVEVCDAAEIAYVFHLCADYDLFDIPEHRNYRGYRTISIDDPFDIYLYVSTPEMKRFISRDSNSASLLALWKYLREVKVLKEKKTEG